MIYSQDEKAIIWLDSFGGITREQKLKIINYTKSPSAIMEDISIISKAVGKNLEESLYNLLKSSLSTCFLQETLKRLEDNNIVAVTCMSDYYPKQFLNIDSPPLIIYCKGNLELLRSKNLFTIVGSRKSLPNILVKAEELSKEISENDITVVTGLAEGIDSAAIKGALPSGNIISILPGGFFHVYPEFNRNLFNKVVENGLAISEYNPDTVSRAYNFPERNRLLAGISKSVLVCSAGKKSGTNYTADFANNYGKDVFAFPYTIGTPSGEGCNALLKDYAMLCDCADDIFTNLGVSKKTENKKTTLSDEESLVYNCIKEGEIHIDLLLQKTGLKIFQISPILMMLEIKKLIVKNPGNTYSAI